MLGCIIFPLIRSIFLGQNYTGVQLLIGLKLQYMFCFDICTPVGRWGKRREGVQISKQSTQNFCPEKYLEPLTSQPFISATLPCSFLLARNIREGRAIASRAVVPPSRDVAAFYAAPLVTFLASHACLNV